MSRAKYEWWQHFPRVIIFNRMNSNPYITCTTCITITTSLICHFREKEWEFTWKIFSIQLKLFSQTFYVCTAKVGVVREFCYCVTHGLKWFCQIIKKWNYFLDLKSKNFVPKHFFGLFSPPPTTKSFDFCDGWKARRGEYGTTMISNMLKFCSLIFFLSRVTTPVLSAPPFKCQTLIIITFQIPDNRSLKITFTQSPTDGSLRRIPTVSTYVLCAHKIIGLIVFVCRWCVWMRVCVLPNMMAKFLVQQWHLSPFNGF